MALSWPDSREPNNTYNPKHVNVITSVEILDQSETQISVDPISLKESKNQNFPFPRFVTPHEANRWSQQPLSLSRAKSKFLSISLPNSASSSPRFSSGILRKKPKNQTQESPFSVDPLGPQHSVELSRLAQLRESHLQRSKSCGEGRAYAPSDDFDLCLTKVNKYLTSSNENVNKADRHKREKSTLNYDEDFKCGALCLYLPGFSKGKPVKSRKEEPTMVHVISRTVSLEKFECGSWTSSAIVNDSEDDAEASSKLYFDLPLELIRSSVNDANSPVRTAFVFEKDRKGVLKNGSSRMGRKSHESSRQVRFSTSSPSSCSPSTSPCITPRLRKAREDFNAFLEAQSA
ncbi:hypothetical protein LguiA_014660 [Lonicera macranthoides]